MMLKKRIERAFQVMKERRALRISQEQEHQLPLEKGDKLAMILAGLITMLPLALIALLLMVGLPLLLTRH